MPPTFQLPRRSGQTPWSALKSGPMSWCRRSGFAGHHGLERKKKPSAMTIEMSDAFEEVDFDYATTIADRANRFMSQHAVPPTPENFSVWFNYAMGESPALRSTIDILVANKRKFDPATNRGLYVAYLSPRADSGVIDDFPEQLRGVIYSAKEF